MQEAQSSTAIDPVCGMTVDIERATTDGRISEYNGMTWYFCGKGCQLEFHDDPDRYFDPNYTPSM